MFHKSADIYDAVYSFKDYATEAATIDTLIQSRMPGAKRLLDVACGTGAHIAHLADHYEVEGLDLDGGMLEIARQRLPDVVLHKGDMAGFDLDKTFDAITCLFSSIAYVETEENLVHAIKTMARHLVPGGVLIVEPWLEPDVFEDGHMAISVVDEPDLKVARMARSRIENGVSVLEFHYLVNRPDGVSQFTEEHRAGLFTTEQHVRAFEAAGLSVDHDPEGLMGRGIYVGARATQ
jgi:SAM-dependent methyltransferase